jgi:hypothetical protein
MKSGTYSFVWEQDRRVRRNFDAPANLMLLSYAFRLTLSGSKQEGKQW